MTVMGEIVVVVMIVFDKRERIFKFHIENEEKKITFNIYVAIYYHHHRRNENHPANKQ